MSPKRACPARSRRRLGLGTGEIASWRILRKSLDARSHDDVHFAYAAEVQLAEDADRADRREPDRPDVQPYLPEHFDWPEPGTRPLRHRPVIVGSGPAGLIAGYLLARGGIPAADPRAGPGRQGPGRRRPSVRRERAARPREQLPLRRGRRGHVQRRQADLPRHRARRPPRAGDPGRLPRQAVDRLRAPAAPRLEPAAAGRPHPPAQARGARRRGPILLPGRGPRHRRRPAPRPARRRRATSPPTWRSWRSATAPATPTACCCAAACRSSPSRSSSASGSSSPRRRSTGRDTATTPATPRSGAADYSRLGPRRPPRPLHLLHVRRRLRDAQRQRPGLLLHQRDEREPPRLPVRQQRPGRHHRAGGTRQRPSPGGHPLPAAVRAAGLPGGRAAPTRRRSSGPGTSSRAGPAAARSRPAIVAAARRSTCGSSCPTRSSRRSSTGSR